MPFSHEYKSANPDHVSAQIVFGILIGTDPDGKQPLPEGGYPFIGNDRNNWEQFYAATHGIMPPVGAVGAAVPNDVYCAHKEAFSDYSSKVIRTANDSGCEILRSIILNWGVETYFAVLDFRSNPWNSVQAEAHFLEIKEESMKISEDQIERLRDFCSRMNIPWTEPKHYLVLHMGL